MYDELVKRLREYAKEHCPLDRGSGICGCIDAREAADAIEELRADNDALNGTITNLLEQIKDLGKPRWIPVTERLPEHGVYVLGRYKNNEMAVVSVFDHDEDFTFWRAQTDEGWEADCDTEPTHWRPLPEPPKEE